MADFPWEQTPKHEPQLVSTGDFRCAKCKHIWPCPTNREIPESHLIITLDVIE